MTLATLTLATGPSLRLGARDPQESPQVAHLQVGQQCHVGEIDPSLREHRMEGGIHQLDPSILVHVSEPEAVEGGAAGLGCKRNRKGAKDWKART